MNLSSFGGLPLENGLYHELKTMTLCTFVVVCFKDMACIKKNIFCDSVGHAKFLKKTTISVKNSYTLLVANRSNTTVCDTVCNYTVKTAY